MRQTVTWYTNAYGVGDTSRDSTIFANDEKKLHVTDAPTAPWWFQRFMLGAKKSMGVLRKQNEALTVRQLLAIIKIAKDD